MEHEGPSYGRYAVIVFAAIFIVADLAFLVGLIRDLMGMS